MSKNSALFVALLCACSAGPAARAATIQLKGQDSVTGKILAEKRDQVIVDIGYTVLVVPRDQIVRILKNSLVHSAAQVLASPKATPEDASMPEPTAQPGFYSSPAGAVPEQSVRNLVKQIGEAVVQVRTPSALGSGFIINPEGFLMTNFHVIQGETRISVQVYLQRDGQLEPHTYKRVRIIAINKFEDLALLKIEDKNAPKFKYVSLGSSDALAVGEHVFAIGSPMGLQRTVTEGILSTKTREFHGELYLQTTAQINPGNSGGPLFNLSGQVVGITNMKIEFGEGLGFAIPVETVKYFLNHRDAFAYSNDNPSNPYRYLQPPSRTGQHPDNK